MANFTVQNLTASTLSVPPPIARVLKAGASATVEAESLDTPAIAALINSIPSKLRVLQQAGNTIGTDSIEHSAKATGGTAPASRIGTVAAPIVLTAGQTMTLTHNLGARAGTVAVYVATSGAAFTENADLTIAQATDNALTVVSTAGGSFIVDLSWDPGVVPLGAAILVTDSKIGIA